MEAFSVAARANAQKFLAGFSDKPVPTIREDAPPPLPLHWPRIADYELEGTVLDMARCYLAVNQCPGILSYHIAAESWKRLSAQSLDGFSAAPAEANSSPSSPGDNKEDVPTNNGDQAVNGVQNKPQLAKFDLDSRLVGKAVLNVVHEVCVEWNSDFPSLTAPKRKIELSLFGIKNNRRKMEDRHALCVDVNSLFSLKDMPYQAYYAVYDGHNGVEAAYYASIHVLSNIVRHPEFQTDLSKAIKDGIRITDDHFCQRGDKSGATAVVAFIRGEELYIGWLGDSQAVLVREGKAVRLVDPHKPEREDEQQRIEAAGGMVIFIGTWRVNGNLSVSRAIGDVKDKKYVIGEGDVSRTVMNGTEDYLVVACDGVWDVVDDQELVECIGGHLSKGSERHTTAKRLVEFAKSEGSGDNITAIIVFLNTAPTTTPQPLSSTATETVAAKTEETNNEGGIPTKE